MQTKYKRPRKRLMLLASVVALVMALIFGLSRLANWLAVLIRRIP